MARALCLEIRTPHSSTDGITIAFVIHKESWESPKIIFVCICNCIGSEPWAFKFPLEILLCSYLSNLTAIGQGRRTTINRAAIWDFGYSVPANDEFTPPLISRISSRCFDVISCLRSRPKTRTRHAEMLSTRPSIGKGFNKQNIFGNN